MQNHLSSHWELVLLLSKCETRRLIKFSLIGTFCNRLALISSKCFSMCTLRPLDLSID